MNPNHREINIKVNADSNSINKEEKWKRRLDIFYTVLDFNNFVITIDDTSPFESYCGTSYIMTYSSHETTKRNIYRLESKGIAKECVYQDSINKEYSYL